MRKLILVTGIFCCSLSVAQKDKKEKFDDILNTTDIQKIEHFLTVAHEDDPRRTVLKPKLIALKNSAWTAGKKDAKPMAARPLVTIIPRAFVNKPNSSEAQEFAKLMAETSTARKEKTVNLLNQLFNNDISSQRTILLIQNNSDCNMIVRINGKQFYNLAVPANGESALVIDKGNYELSSNMCDKLYLAQKDIKKNMLIMLNNPVVKGSEKRFAKSKNTTGTAKNNNLN